MRSMLWASGVGMTLAMALACGGLLEEPSGPLPEAVDARPVEVITEGEVDKVEGEEGATEVTPEPRPAPVAGTETTETTTRAVTVAEGSCPSSADTRSRFADGARVRLIATHPDDAYHGDVSFPVEGTVDGDLHNNGDCWFGGGFDGDNGRSFYFYKGAFEFISDGGGGTVASTTRCPSGVATGSTIAAGTRVSLVALHPDDAYTGFFNSLPISGRADGMMSNNGECWFGGSFIADNGDDYYFYKGAFRIDGGAAPAPVGTSCPAGAFTGTIPGGSSVRLLATHPDDAYHGSISMPVEGRVEGDLHSNDGCWLGGGFVDNRGNSYYFYKAAFRPE